MTKEEIKAVNELTFLIADIEKCLGDVQNKQNILRKKLEDIKNGTQFVKIPLAEGTITFCFNADGSLDPTRSGLGVS